MASRVTVDLKSCSYETMGTWIKLKACKRKLERTSGCMSSSYTASSIIRCISWIDSVRTCQSTPTTEKIKFLLMIWRKIMATYVRHPTNWPSVRLNTLDSRSSVEWNFGLHPWLSLPTTKLLSLITSFFTYFLWLVLFLLWQICLFHSIIWRLIDLKFIIIHIW